MDGAIFLFLCMYHPPHGSTCHVVLLSSVLQCSFQYYPSSTLRSLFIYPHMTAPWPRQVLSGWYNEPHRSPSSLSHGTPKPPKYRLVFGVGRGITNHLFSSTHRTPFVHPLPAPVWRGVSLVFGVRLLDHRTSPGTGFVFFVSCCLGLVARGEEGVCSNGPNLSIHIYHRSGGAMF